MGHGSRWWVGFAGVALLLAGCPGDTEIADGSSNGSGSSGSPSRGGSGSGGAGRSSLAGAGGGSAGRSAGTGGRDPGSPGSGGGGSGAAGASGDSGGGSGGGCPNALPALCRMCADNSCGSPVCVGGRWEFRCPEDGNAGQGGSGNTSCFRAGCSGELCSEDPNLASPCIFREEYACYQNATCEPQADGQCGWTSTPALEACLGGSGGGLRWYTTCGDPVCMSEPDLYDDPNIPNCTGQQHGDPCTERDAQCDGIAGCGATLLCTDRDPTMQIGGCPISRARFKQDIEYVSERELRSYHDQLMSMQLASYHYRTAPQSPRQLGFIIEDIEPSVAVSGDHVNLYGYLSMAVAAIQVQQQQISELQQELQALRDERAQNSDAPLCE